MFNCENIMKENKPDLVSIIIPAYNAEKTIGKSIQSALAQLDADVEIVVVNDGSTDKTEVICQTILKNDNRVKLVSKKNEGVASARNMGIKSATGHYIAWLDADDTMEPDFCTIMISHIKETGADMAICGYNNIFEDHTTLICPTHWDESKLYDIRTCLTELVERNLTHPLWNKMYVREKIACMFDESYKVGEDIKFTLKYLLDNRYVCFVHKAVYNYHVLGANSLTRAQGSTLRSILLTYDLLVETTSSLKIEIQSFDNYFVGFIYGYLRNLARSNLKCERNAKKKLLMIMKKAKPKGIKRVIQKQISLWVLNYV